MRDGVLNSELFRTEPWYLGKWVINNCEWENHTFLLYAKNMFECGVSVRALYLVKMCEVQKFRRHLCLYIRFLRIPALSQRQCFLSCLQIDVVLTEEFSKLCSATDWFLLMMFHKLYYINICNLEIHFCQYAISGYHRNEFSSSNAFAEHKFSTKSWTSEQSFMSVYHVESVSNNNILCEYVKFSMQYKGYMLYNEGSLHNNIRGKKNRHYCINICFILVLTLHVSTPILGHHQVYNDTSLSSWIACNFNMDPNCIHVSIKCIN
jgi:hypothetical protein